MAVLFGGGSQPEDLPKGVSVVFVLTLKFMFGFVLTGTLVCVVCACAGKPVGCGVYEVQAYRYTLCLCIYLDENFRGVISKGTRCS